MNPILAPLMILAFSAFVALPVNARAGSDLSAVRAKLQEFREQPSFLRLEQAFDAATAIGHRPAKREERLIALLEVLQHIQQNETPNFNPADDPGYAHPLRSEFPDGPAGEDQFAIASEKHQEKLRLYRFQWQLHSLKKIAMEEIEEFVRRALYPEGAPRCQRAHRVESYRYKT